MKKVVLVAAALTGLAAPVFAADFEPERRALFVSILEANDCKMNNFQPANAILESIQENGFSRDEVRAIGTDLLDSGDAVRDGENMVLRIGACT